MQHVAAPLCGFRRVKTIEHKAVGRLLSETDAHSRAFREENWSKCMAACRAPSAPRPVSRSTAMCGRIHHHFDHLETRLTHSPEHVFRFTVDAQLVFFYGELNTGRVLKGTL